MAGMIKRVIWAVPVLILFSGAGTFALFSRENKAAYTSAVSFFKQNQAIIKNKNYIAVIDYSKPSFVKRLFIYDLHTGTAETYLVAHGRESGFIFARDFSNDIDSHKSCTGFFTTGDVFIGEQGLSLLLHGLQEGLNNNAFERSIIIHGADYVSWKSILENWGRLGRSLGCPAVSTDSIHEVIDKLHDGALLYIHAH